MLDLGDEYYPQLVRIFYAKVRVVKIGSVFTLECQVKYTRFTLTESDLKEIIDLPTVHQLALSQI